MAANFEQLEPFIGELPEKALGKMLDSWPGPVTWVVPAAEGVAEELTGGRTTIALRVSAHPVVQALCEAADSALVSTSANRSGRQPARSILETRLRFGMDVDDIVPGKLGGQKGPTEVREALTGKILRPAE